MVVANKTDLVRGRVHVLGARPTGAASGQSLVPPAASGGLPPPPRCPCRSADGQWWGHPPVLINRCGAQAEQREVSTDVGVAFARAHGCLFVETSAKGNVAVDQAFEELVHRVSGPRRCWVQG